MLKLRELYIRGFTSFDGERGARIPFGDVTVLLGANGAGKSNLLSFFLLLRAIGRRELPQFVGKYGANRLLFYGSKTTQAISYSLEFEDGRTRHKHTDRLFYQLPDGLFIEPRIVDNPTGEDFRNAFFGERFRMEAYKFLANICIYQFSDTSETSVIRGRSYADDAKNLHSDGGNLAAFLKMLRGNAAYRKYYDRSVHHIQRVMPQFGDFDLESIPGADEYVRLNWRDASGSGYLFDPHQISDGSLRFMALAALLLQPPELMPKFIILDEPELGLHPAALSELRAMVRSASRHAQVLIATQSPRLVDEFSPDEVVIVERDAKLHSSVFRKLDSETLADWLARYSLSELWEKNVIGGQP